MGEVSPSEVVYFLGLSSGVVVSAHAHLGIGNSVGNGSHRGDFSGLWWRPEKGRADAGRPPLIVVETMNRLLYGVPMTTSLPRLQVTIDPELGAVLKALSKASGKPQASIIRELMLEAVPSLESVVEALTLAKSGLREEAVARMVKLADASVVEVNQTTLPFRRKPGRPRKRV